MKKPREFDYKRLRWSSRPNAANIDRGIFKRWENRELNNHGAMERMMKNNGWVQELTDLGFMELANSLGYWRPGELPPWARTWKTIPED